MVWGYNMFTANGLRLHDAHEFWYKICFFSNNGCKTSGVYEKDFWVRLLLKFKLTPERLVDQNIEKICAAIIDDGPITAAKSDAIKVRSVWNQV